MTNPTIEVLRVPDERIPTLRCPQGTYHEVWLHDHWLIVHTDDRVILKGGNVDRVVVKDEVPALLAALLENAGWHSFWIKRDSEGLPVGGFHTESGPGLTKIMLQVGGILVPAEQGE